MLAPASHSSSTSRWSTCTQWMQRQAVPRCTTPSCTRYSTGERPHGVSGMPRARNVSANGPVPSRTNSVSASDSARCTATGHPSRRARSATARYSGSLTVYGACGETPRLRGEGAKSGEGMLQLGHARGAVRGVGTEDLLVVDPAPAEPRQRLERRTCASRVSDASDAGGPRVAHPQLRRTQERFRGGGVLEGAERADPRREVALRILAGEVSQLEVRVCVDEAGNETGLRKVELPGSPRRGHARMRADGGDGAAIVNENGAVRNRWRRYGEDRSSADA